MPSATFCILLQLQLASPLVVGLNCLGWQGGQRPQFACLWNVFSCNDLVQYCDLIDWDLLTSCDWENGLGGWTCIDQHAPDVCKSRAVSNAVLEGKSLYSSSKKTKTPKFWEMSGCLQQSMNPSTNEMPIRDGDYVSSSLHWLVGRNQSPSILMWLLYSLMAACWRPNNVRKLLPSNADYQNLLLCLYPSYELRSWQV